MDPDAVELGTEVVEPVQFAFARAPVEPVGPVGEELLQVAEVGALLPWTSRRRFGPPRAQNPPTEVGEDRLIDADREAFDPYAHHRPADGLNRSAPPSLATLDRQPGAEADKDRPGHDLDHLPNTRAA